MWGFVPGCCCTSSVITLIECRRNRWARHVKFARKVRHTHTVFCVTREEKGLVEILRQRLMPK